MTTPAMTAQEALANLRAAATYYSSDAIGNAAASLEAALSEAERRATEAEARAKISKDNALWALASREQMESRLSAVEGRCGLMRALLAQFGQRADALSLNTACGHISRQMLVDARELGAEPILAYPGGKSDDDDPLSPEELELLDRAWAVHKAANPPAGGEGKPEPMKATPLMIATLRDELGWHKGWLDICERALNAALAVAPLSRSGDSALVESRKLKEARQIIISLLPYARHLQDPTGPSAAEHHANEADRWLAEHPEVQQHGERK